ncbi:HAMP domain-containing histidine kinase [Desulfovibrio aminophilus]|nr:HAMP domain-containing sensor histidine kinase [Desulfovibrio aminophilus]MCM0755990.1 HAMP domain-containing histidine kinase [Desulfovibrio aminophilus]
MRSIPWPKRLSITTKLLLWCLALIVIFYATTTFLLLRIRDIVDVSGSVATAHHEIDSATQRMIRTLLSLEENRKRYEILKKDDYIQYMINDLAGFKETLDRVLERYPEYRERWKPLTEEFSIILSTDSGPESLVLPDKTVNSWITLLAESRQANQAETETQLHELNQAGRDAARMGFFGLMASITAGLAGSVLIAYRLNRSLSEVRRGIRDLAQGGEMKPVRVLSSDELGELARAFNSMTARLRQEEQMRSDFISMLSHEIRTPLTSIRESVELVADGVFGDLNERQLHFLEISKKEIQRLTSLLTRLMTVSSMEANDLKLRPEPLDAEIFTRSVIERIQPAATAKSIHITLRMPPAPCRALADFEHTQQVLLNLLGNAVKFSPTGSRITVSVEARDDRVVFCVRDEGRGIPEAEQAYVFRKYYREPSVRASVDGVGLGLSIAKRIVDAHGGEMWLTSEEGKGSCFCFSLPKVAELE